MQFVTEDFLLHSETAKRLYHDVAERMPILDYHCHLSAKDIAQNVSFGNLTNVWLDNDHYKWTAMRCCGTDEALITGDAADYDKYLAYVRCLGSCIGNPLYHWSHLEMKRSFGFDGVLNEESAPEAWKMANARLAQMRARDFMREANVKLVCTTDDPVDDLAWHRALRDEGFEIRVLPAFRPDRVVDIRRADYLPYLAQLSQVSGVKIEGWATLTQALDNRLAYFAAHGCKLSDHGLTSVSFAQGDDAQADALLQKKLRGEAIGEDEAVLFQSQILLWLARAYHRLDWTMQLHFGVLRDVNPTLYSALGVDAGGDCIGAPADIAGLAKLMGTLEATRELPRMILYSINPTDNAALSVLAGCFQTSEARGKIQHGSAWWFNDTKPGMEAQLAQLASVSALGSFVGMLTDSRSFLSYARHEYFRRILCNYIGGMVETGEYPNDRKQLDKLVRDICYRNAETYFRF